MISSDGGGGPGSGGVKGGGPSPMGEPRLWKRSTKPVVARIYPRIKQRAGGGAPSYKNEIVESRIVLLLKAVFCKDNPYFANFVR